MKPSSVKKSMSRATLLGTGDDGTTPCVLLEDGKRRLLINASEGLQRLSFEHALRLHRDLDAVLLSSLAPTAVAGLPGLLLLMGDAGVASVHVLGPIGTASLVRSFSAFVQPRTHILVSELTGDEVISWRGHTDIFGLPLERGAAHEAQACAAERWITANGGCFPHRTGLLPRLADERMLPVKRRRDDAGVDEVARELIDANEEEESEEDSSDEDGTSSDASNDTSSSSAGAAAAPPANTSAAKLTKPHCSSRWWAARRSLPCSYGARAPTRRFVNGCLLSGWERAWRSVRRLDHRRRAPREAPR